MDEQVQWHHVHYEYTIAAVVIGRVCPEGPGCSFEHAHIAIIPPPEKVEEPT